MKNLNLIVFLFLFFFFACSNLDNTINTSDLSIKSRGGSPEVVNGILTFSDWSEFSEYYFYLDSIANNAEDSDSTLLEIELDLSHSSYRADNYVSELAEEEFRDYFEAEYIPDIVLQSILNEYAEYRVDSSFYIYLGKNRVYEIKALNTHTLNEFRSIERGTSTPPVHLYNEFVGIKSGGGDIFVGGGIGDPIEPRGPVLPIAKIDFAPLDVCGHDFERRLVVSFHYPTISGNIPLEGDWTITWGDGTAQNINDVSSINIIHDYEEHFSDIDVEIYINYNDPQSGPENFTKVIPHVRIAAQCLFLEHSEIYDPPTANSGWRFVGKLWFNDSGFNNGTHAYTHAWRWSNNKNKWIRDCAELDVWVAIDWFYPANCGEEGDYEEEHDQCNNCKRIQAAEYHGGTFRDGNPQSDHRLAKGSLIMFCPGLVLDKCD